MIDAIRTPCLTAPLGRETAADDEMAYFFALDTDGRIAWPFRLIQDAAGRRDAQRWRFGHWVSSRETARFLTGEDDLCTATDVATVDAWIRRERKLSGLRLPPPHQVAETMGTAGAFGAE